jgi:hypothetical protein
VYVADADANADAKPKFYTGIVTDTDTVTDTHGTNGIRKPEEENGRELW